MNDNTQTVLEALENTAFRDTRMNIGRRTTSNKRDVELWRKKVLRFIEDVPPEMSVQELREALEELEYN